MNDNDYYMSIALQLAQEAEADNEAPVGCVIVDSFGAVIGRGRNRREKTKSALAHAELEAIEDACNTLNDWRLSGCSMYVTLEPCPMCAGAVMMSRIDKLVFGARDELTGSCVSVINLFMEDYGHKTQIIGGIMADESSNLMKEFFERIRNPVNLNKAKD